MWSTTQALKANLSVDINSINLLLVYYHMVVVVAIVVPIEEGMSADIRFISTPPNVSLVFAGRRGHKDRDRTDPKVRAIESIPDYD